MSVRWTFSDTTTATPVTYSWEVNPNQDSPNYSKNVQYSALLEPGDVPLLFEGADTPTVFNVQGILLTETQYQQLLYFYELRHQFQCTDDLGRVRWLYITSFQPVRTPTALYPWKHTYTLSGFVISETLPPVITPPAPVAPTVTSLSPAVGGTAGGASVTVTGTGFTNATKVTFGGVPVSFSIISGTSIIATTPSGTAGTSVHVQVTSSAGASTLTGSDLFLFEAAPTVTSLSPITGPPAGGTTVTITGTNFTGATAVTFGATAAASFVVVSSTQITAVTPAEAAGTIDVYVTTPAGTNTTAATPTNAFTFLAGPVITSISPTAGPLVGGTAVTINGSGFTGVTTVKFGTTAASSFTIVSDVQITTTSPAESAGTVHITAINPTGTSATSSADQFSYDPIPTVTLVAPTGGTTAGGTSVVLTGTGFTGATTVKFGTTSASFTVNSSTQITATSPAHTAGTIDIFVTTPGGTNTTAATPTNAYTYS